MSSLLITLIPRKPVIILPAFKYYLRLLHGQCQVRLTVPLLVLLVPATVPVDGAPLGPPTRWLHGQSESVPPGSTSVQGIRSPDQRIAHKANGETHHESRHHIILHRRGSTTIPFRF